MEAICMVVGRERGERGFEERGKKKKKKGRGV